MSRYIYTSKNDRLALKQHGPTLHIHREYRWREDPNGWRIDPDAGITMKVRHLPDFIASLSELYEDCTPVEKEGTPR